jgi:GMP synthase-like glutamine amidotransferase
MNKPYFTRNDMHKAPVTIKIGLIDFHKHPDVGVNEYTKNIGRTVKSLRDDTEVEIIKTFDNLKIKKQYRLRPSVDISNYDAVILSGSDYNHSHRNVLLRHLVRNIVEDAKIQHKNVLGICSGIQLLARAHGYEVRDLPHPEAAWYTMSKTPLGIKNPFFKGIPDTFPGFSTHAKEVVMNGVFDETVLVTNSNCIQAVEFHHTEDCIIVGTQFHPEDTHASAQEYLEEYEAESKGKPLREDTTQTPTTLYGHVLLSNFIHLAEERKKKHLEHGR